MLTGARAKRHSRVLSIVRRVQLLRTGSLRCRTGVRPSSHAPEDLARLHPRLYHLTAPGNAERIRRNGLLSARAIVDRLGIEGAERVRLLERPRPIEVRLAGGGFTLNDNRPLTEAALERCLDDGLTPAQWLHALNGRVYLWPSEGRLRTLLGARTNRVRPREVVVFDTLSLARAHAERIRLSPINGGSTLRRPARRGRDTYAPLAAHDYETWRRLRGRLDTIAEVAVEGAVPDAAGHIVEVRPVSGAPDRAGRVRKVPPPEYPEHRARPPSRNSHSDRS